MPKVEIYHNMTKFKIRERVFATNHLEGGLHIMDIYKRYWLQNPECFHTIKVNGRFRTWDDLRKVYHKEIEGHRLRGKKCFDQWQA